AATGLILAPSERDLRRTCRGNFVGPDRARDRRCASVSFLAVSAAYGSGLYQMEELRDTAEHKIDTPFGPPSDVLVGGKLGGRQVYFLPRHGRGHRILPHEINYRANIYALRSLDVRWIISVAAVGSLQEKYAPRDVVLPSQFYDRSSQRAAHTFFGEGIAAHVGFAEPISASLRNLVAESATS